MTAPPGSGIPHICPLSSFWNRGRIYKEPASYPDPRTISGLLGVERYDPQLLPSHNVLWQGTAHRGGWTVSKQPVPSASGSHILSHWWSSCRAGARVCVPRSTWCRREPAFHNPDACTGYSAYVAWQPRPFRFRSTSLSMPRIAPSSSPARICPLIVRYCCTVSSGFFFFRYDNAARIFSVSIRSHSLLCTDG